MTIQETCKRLGKSESTVRRWIREGKLDAAKVDGVFNVSDEAVEALFTNQSNDQPAEDSGDQLSPEVVTQLVNQLRSENEYLKERIQELESARERADQITMQMTSQLTSQQKMLEHYQEPWIKRVFKRKKKDANRDQA